MLLVSPSVLFSNLLFPKFNIQVPEKSGVCANVSMLLNIKIEVVSSRVVIFFIGNTKHYFSKLMLKLNHKMGL